MHDEIGFLLDHNHSSLFWMKISDFFYPYNFMTIQITSQIATDFVYATTYSRLLINQAMLSRFRKCIACNCCREGRGSMSK